MLNCNLAVKGKFHQQCSKFQVGFVNSLLNLKCNNDCVKFGVVHFADTVRVGYTTVAYLCDPAKFSHTET